MDSWPSKRAIKLLRRKTQYLRNIHGNILRIRTDRGLNRERYLYHVPGIIPKKTQSTFDSQPQLAERDRNQL